MGVLLPNVTSVAAVGIIFTLIFARDFGLVNWLLGHVGVDPIAWQDHRWSSWLAISTMVDWRWTGYNALIFLAALQAVPTELYEAARDRRGARLAQQFWSITVPMLRPTIDLRVRSSPRSAASSCSPSRCCSTPAPTRSPAARPRQFQTADDVPLRAGVHRTGVRVRLDDRLGAVPVHRGVRRRSTCCCCAGSDRPSEDHDADPATHPDPHPDPTAAHHRSRAPSSHRR